MGKIAQVSVKYIIHATLKADGLIDRPDIIGAIFGQTEGLLGKDLELRELQKGGRIGRIDVDTADKDGKTTARIQIPSSLDKTQTAIIAAAVETIDRIGPTNGKIILDKIEDVRGGKRDYIQERAKEILSKFIKEGDESAEIEQEVSKSVREAEVVEFGPDRITAGPEAESASEVIAVEGRADVLALIRAGFLNVVSVNGTKAPPTAVNLLRSKRSVTAFVDGDRGGELIAKTLSQLARVDYIAVAPDGKEVEELTSKEIIKCLRNKEPFVQETVRNNYRESRTDYREPKRDYVPRVGNFKGRDFFLNSLSEVEGKSVIRLYNRDLKLLGELPLGNLHEIRGLNEVFAIVADGPINDELLYFGLNNGAEVILGNKVETRKRSRIKLVTPRTF